MRLTSNDLYLLSQCAISAATQAGHLIARYAQTRVVVNTKNGGASLAAKVVTEVDHLSQDIILKTLHPNCLIYDLALLSEESPDDYQRLQKDYFWCIDPLDGTLPFIESVPGYSVSIALLSREGQSILGVVYDPVTQTLYHAIQGQGTWQNTEIFTATTQTPSLSQTLTLITDKSITQEALYSATLAELENLASDLGYGGFKLQLQGGAAMNACHVLNDPASCYFKFPKPHLGGGSIWDYAATACLFTEAGLPVSDIYGQSLVLNPEGSTFMNHCGVLYASNPTIADGMIGLYQKLNIG
jgi:3'(2'), 5'-bisphosphate nucleotidase/myo-inositol-1(or 4)-monophosphatase